MTHYIRDKDNNTIVDIEATDADISCTVCIGEFTKYLLDLPILKWPDFTLDMDELQEIRGHYWETVSQDKTPNEFAKEWCEIICKAWGLYYVTD